MTTSPSKVQKGALFRAPLPPTDWLKVSKRFKDIAAEYNVQGNFEKAKYAAIQAGYALSFHKARLIQQGQK